MNSDSSDEEEDANPARSKAWNMFFRKGAIYKVSASARGDGLLAREMMESIFPNKIIFGDVDFFLMYGRLVLAACYIFFGYVDYETLIRKDVSLEKKFRFCH